MLPPREQRQKSLGHFVSVASVPVVTTISPTPVTPSRKKRAAVSTPEKSLEAITWVSADVVVESSDTLAVGAGGAVQQAQTTRSRDSQRQTRIDPKGSVAYSWRGGLTDHNEP